MLALFGLALAGMQTRPAPVAIETQWDGARCVLIAVGRTLSPEALARDAAEWARHGKPVSTEDRQ